MLSWQQRMLSPWLSEKAGECALPNTRNWHTKNKWLILLSCLCSREFQMLWEAKYKNRTDSSIQQWDENTGIQKIPVNSHSKTLGIALGTQEFMLLFSKDTLNWSKLTALTCIMLQKNLNFHHVTLKTDVMAAENDAYITEIIHIFKYIQIEKGYFSLSRYFTILLVLLFFYLFK